MDKSGGDRYGGLHVFAGNGSGGGGRGRAPASVWHVWLSGERFMIREQRKRAKWNERLIEYAPPDGVPSLHRLIPETLRTSCASGMSMPAMLRT